MDDNSEQLSNLGRQATIFLIHRLLNFWLQHLNIEFQNSLLSNINDDGDNKNLKTRVGIFKNIGGNIPGGSFPDTP